jgi:hypothetical protein
MLLPIYNNCIRLPSAQMHNSPGSLWPLPPRKSQPSDKLNLVVMNSTTGSKYHSYRFSGRTVRQHAFSSSSNRVHSLTPCQMAGRDSASWAGCGVLVQHAVIGCMRETPEHLQLSSCALQRRTSVQTLPDRRHSRRRNDQTSMDIPSLPDWNHHSAYLPSPSASPAL